MKAITIKVGCLLSAVGAERTWRGEAACQALGHAQSRGQLYHRNGVLAK